MQMNTPRVLSRMLVMKYQRHSSEEESEEASPIEIVRFMK